MKLRWRVLTQAEMEAGESRGAVYVRRNDHYVHQCVLEFQLDHEAGKEHWESVELMWPLR